MGSTHHWPEVVANRAFDVQSLLLPLKPNSKLFFSIRMSLYLRFLNFEPLRHYVCPYPMTQIHKTQIGYLLNACSQSSRNSALDLSLTLSKETII
ncbi:hypothetical protein Hanom_Chr10g00914691 [Helianthus anomalus]